MKIKIFFGSKFDGYEYPQLLVSDVINVRYDTVYTLVEFLCHRFGVFFPARQDSYLRIDQYQQSLFYYLQEYPEVFYADSFTVDPISTTRYLLELRDELVMGGYDFEQDYADTPYKVAVLQEIERASPPLSGFADAVYHLCQCMKDLDSIEVIHAEPLHLLPPWLQHFFSTMRSAGAKFDQAKLSATKPQHTDLATLALFLENHQPSEAAFKNDGSIQLVKDKNLNAIHSKIAMALAKPEQSPLLYLPYGAYNFDSCLQSMGAPTLGVKSISKGRPMLQIFRSLSMFLWDPLDVQGLLEFTKLPVKPLEFRLSFLIGNCLSQYPGIGGDIWQARIDNYFTSRKEAASDAKERKKLKIDREQYRMLFERKRHAIHQPIPIKEILELVEFFKAWALDLIKFKQDTSMFSFIEVAEQLIELLLNMLDNQLEIQRLSLDQLIESLLAPISNSNMERYQGHVPIVFHSQNITAAVDECWWVGFSFQESKIKFDAWSRQEMSFLKTNRIAVNEVNTNRAYENWQKLLPIQATSNKLVLFYPETIDGEEQQWHPIYGKIKALFGEVPVWQLDDWLRKSQPTLEKTKLNPYQSAAIHPFLQVNGSIALLAEETCSNLETLLKYPHIWYLRSKLGIQSARNNKLQALPTFKGNLAHRLLEIFFQENGYKMNQLEIMDWFSRRPKDIFPKEGALFLEYGLEPEKLEFLNTLERAVIHLVHSLRDNGWAQPQAEKDVKGTFCSIPLKGRSDLVLQRGDAWLIIDYKWRGKSRLENVLKNDADYQLQMYANLIDTSSTIYTTYYILDSRFFLAKTVDAIEQVKPTHGDIDIRENQQLILDKLNKTIHWRLKQLDKGLVEIRTQRRLEMLDETYEESLLELIELPEENFLFDEYLLLLGEIN